MTDRGVVAAYPPPPPHHHFMSSGKASVVPVIMSSSISPTQFDPVFATMDNTDTQQVDGLHARIGNLVNRGELAFDFNCVDVG